MVKKGTTGIYAIINMIDGKKYIGQAVDIKERNRGELSNLKGNIFDNPHLQSAFNKYGEENFIFIFLEECTEEKLDEREIYHVAAAGWPDHDLCYNIRKGGKGGGRQSSETCKKISKTRKKMFASGELESWNKDKKMSEESNKKKSEALTGKKKSKEHCENISKTRKKGEDNPSAKLNNSNLWTILRMFQLGYSGKYIASLFNVSEQTISNIKNGKKWNHIEHPSNTTIPDKFKVLLRTDNQ